MSDRFYRSTLERLDEAHNRVMVLEHKVDALTDFCNAQAKALRLQNQALEALNLRVKDEKEEV